MDIIDFILLVLVAAAVLFVFFHDKWGSLFSAASQPAALHDAGLVRTLLGLDDAKLKELLEIYEKEFGPGPARYARRTLRKWKAGEVQPASQTFERFLLHLPKVMSFDLKCEVLRHFMEQYAAKDRYELDVTPADWEEKLDPLVEQVVEKAFTANLPSEIEDKLDWLGSGDMQAARAMLRASLAAESRLMVSLLHKEFESFERVLEEKHLKPRVTHMLEFPYGTIKMNVRRSR